MKTPNKTVVTPTDGRCQLWISVETRARLKAYTALQRQKSMSNAIQHLLDTVDAEGAEV